jgi:hypothetical protein
VKPPEAGLLTSAELCELTGATYRQIDYWTRVGILKPAQITGRTRGEAQLAEGSGSRRWWRASDAKKVGAMVAVSAATVGNQTGPSRLLQIIGRSDEGGPWVCDEGGYRITVKSFTKVVRSEL